MPVALLTGRVYQDGLGGLRAVLFWFLEGFFGTDPRHKSDMRSFSYACFSIPKH